MYLSVFLHLGYSYELPQNVINYPITSFKVGVFLLVYSQRERQIKLNRILKTLIDLTLAKTYVAYYDFIIVL